MNFSKTFLHITFASCLLAQTACAKDQQGETTITPKIDKTQPVADLAIETLSQQIGETKNAIEIVSVTAVDWPDASLGCPKEGLFYPQVITPGHRVQLKSGAKVYQVHTAQQRALICDKPGKQKLEVPRKKLGPLAIESLTSMAKTDLAHKLGVDKTNITVKKINEVTWPDTSLGCPQGKTQYMKKEIRGYVIHLDVSGKDYTYHTDKEQTVVACPPIASE